jgi:hypothetical protein
MKRMLAVLLVGLFAAGMLTGCPWWRRDRDQRGQEGGYQHGQEGRYQHGQEGGHDDRGHDERDRY